MELILQTSNGCLTAEICAAATLLTNYYAKKDIKTSILRCRDIEPNTNNVLIGIGGIYDYESMKFDHHQTDFNEKWNNSDILLSTSGLIWRHFGKEIVEMYLTANSDEYDNSNNYTVETIDELTNIIYFNLIAEIDANEHGIYSETKLNLTNLVNCINDTSGNEKKQNENFSKAVTLLGFIFDIFFKKIISSYFNFPKDLEILKNYNLSAPYLIVNEKIPTIFKCLRKIDPDNNVKFVIFKKDDEYNDASKIEYLIKTRNCPKFTPMIPILSENILKTKVLQPDDILFVHKAFLNCKTKTLNTAIEIVFYSLTNYMINEEKKQECKVEINENEQKEIIKNTGTSKTTFFGIISLVSLAVFGVYCYSNKN